MTGVRRLAADDLAALTTRVELARGAGDLLASSDPHGEWLVPFAQGEPWQVAVADDDGSIAGFVIPEAKVVVVEPGHRRRGIGRALVDAGLEIERDRGRPQLIMGVLPDHDAGVAFLEATGFAFHSTLWDLDLPATVTVEPPAWPPGVRARALDPEHDIPAWAELFNAAFAEHPTPLQLDPERVVEGWSTWPSQGEDLLLAEDASGTLLGFCATEPRRSPGGGVEPRAEIWTIGVRPDAQRRGLGRRLLRWGVHHLRAVGAETVTLSVNGRNVSALGLYEAEGFVCVSTRDRWARPVVADPDADS